jgi:hypothetical protein
MGSRWQVSQSKNVPMAIRQLSTLPTHDYVDLFVATLRDASATSAEEWARAAMEGASPAGRFLAWRTLLSLRLESEKSPGYIAGWRIVDRAEHWISVEAKSWFMSANIVFSVDADRVNFATFVRYDVRLVAAMIWPAVSVIHRAVAPDFLRAGVRRIDGRPKVAA